MVAIGERRSRLRLAASLYRDNTVVAHTQKPASNRRESTAAGTGKSASESVEGAPAADMELVEVSVAGRNGLIVLARKAARSG